MESEDAVYVNRDIVLQNKSSKERPTPVRRPECPGQEDQEDFYENFDRNESSSPQQEHYQDLKIEKPPVAVTGRSQTATGVRKQERISVDEKGKLRASSDMILANTSTIDDRAKEIQSAEPMRPLSKLQIRGEGRKFAENIEMQGLGKQALQSSPPREVNQSFVKTRLIICLSIFTLFIALAALILVILVALGPLEKNQCNCTKEIRDLKMQIMRIESRMTKPESTSAKASKFTAPGSTPMILKTVQASFNPVQTTIRFEQSKYKPSSSTDFTILSNMTSNSSLSLNTTTP